MKVKKEIPSGAVSAAGVGEANRSFVQKSLPASRTVKISTVLKNARTPRFRTTAAMAAAFAPRPRAISRPRA